MDLFVAAAWGGAGGIAAGLLALASAIVAAGYTWPWKYRPWTKWPTFTVYCIGVVLGVVATAAASQQMTGFWPAFLMGAAAPSVIRSAVKRARSRRVAPGVYEYRRGNTSSDDRDLVPV